MLRNPLHLRLGKFQTWQHLTFMACLCERMYPNYHLFCLHTEFTEPQRYRKILDLVWESLLFKESKIDFDLQLVKLETAIPESQKFAIYGVGPAIDACEALSELLHAFLSGESLEHAIAVSQISLKTVALLEMTRNEQQMSEKELINSQVIIDEWDVQWEIFRLLLSSEKHDSVLIKGLRSDIRETEMSNIGINYRQ